MGFKLALRHYANLCVSDPMSTYSVLVVVATFKQEEVLVGAFVWTFV